MDRRLTSVTAFIFLVISYYAYRFPNRTNRTSTPSSVAAPGNSTANNHIIRFLQYNKAHELREYLERRVKSTGWKWVERRNPASRFPTDFALVAIEDRRRDFLIAEFVKLKKVKDVSLDLSYQRGTLNADVEGGGSGAFVDGKKRPGKIFTAMSFGEGENTVANATGSRSSWRRNLMMQERFLRVTRSLM